MDRHRRPTAGGPHEQGTCRRADHHVRHTPEQEAGTEPDRDRVPVRDVLDFVVDAGPALFQNPRLGAVLVAVLPGDPAVPPLQIPAVDRLHAALLAAGAGPPGGVDRGRHVFVSFNVS